MVKTSMSVTASNCTEAKRMAQSKTFCDALAHTMATQLSIAKHHVGSSCTLGGSCSRRLSVPPDSLTRKLSGQPTVKVDFQITVPSGSSSSSMISSLNAVSPSSFLSSVTASLAGTSFQGSVTSVTAVSQPTTSISIAGFECFMGQSCMFDHYEIGTQYKIHKTTAFTSSQCAEACWADDACEAFESLSGAFSSSYGNSLPYHCAFWMQGACNIETVGNKAQGFVSGYPGVVFCDKNTSRYPVTASNGHTFVLKSAMYSIVLMVSINVW